MKNILIIGFGKAGSHLYYALKASGKYHVNNFSFRIFQKQVTSADIIFICTEDYKIKTVVHDILRLKIPLKVKIIFHVSGSVTSDVLRPFKRKDAFIGSFHPVQTFESKARKDNKRFKNIFIALEGDKKSLNSGKEIAKSLCSDSFVIDKRQKQLHHINCICASGYQLAHLYQIEKTAWKTIKRVNKIGFNKERFFDIYSPLTEQTLRNISDKGFIASLTGPIERGDIETVKSHLIFLRQNNPKLLSEYVYLGTVSCELAFQKKSIGTTTKINILSLLKRFDKK